MKNIFFLAAIAISTNAFADAIDSQFTEQPKHTTCYFFKSDNLLTKQPCVLKVDESARSEMTLIKVNGQRYIQGASGDGDGSFNAEIGLVTKSNNTIEKVLRDANSTAKQYNRDALTYKVFDIFDSNSNKLHPHSIICYVNKNQTIDLCYPDD